MKYNCTPCYRGVWRRFEWLDIILANIIQKFDIASISFSEFTRSRVKIPACVRVQVWNKVNPNNDIGDGVCFVCSEDLKYKDMEVAHIQAHALGGSDHIDNLLPTCKRCNRDCGIMNLLEYKRLVELSLSG